MIITSNLGDVSAVNSAGAALHQPPVCRKMRGRLGPNFRLSEITDNAC